MSLSLFIAGDVVPKDVQEETFRSNKERIFGAIKPWISKADFSIVNLEAPALSGPPVPIKKDGPGLHTSPTSIEVLKDVGFDVISLANNHFFDQGQKGVECTISACLENKIRFVGAGKNFEEARSILYINSNDKTVAIINACEHEFSIANSEHGGSNPIDLVNMQEDISSARRKADYVIVILHGGIEHYHYPTPRMKRWYRHFVDLGADAVVNHHQHCINGYEVYKGKPIFYGLGNFYFPWSVQSKLESWKFGYAVLLSMDKMIGFELIPYEQTEKSISLRKMDEFEKEIEQYNIPITNDVILQQLFDEYIIGIERSLEADLLPSFLRQRYMLALIKRGFFGKLYYGRAALKVKNKLNCESHYELLQRLSELLI